MNWKSFSAAWSDGCSAQANWNGYCYAVLQMKLRGSPMPENLSVTRDKHIVKVINQLKTV